MTAEMLPPGLVYVSDEEPGISRKRSGKGFSYYLPDNFLIKDRAEKERINKLVIPPAWSDVWICLLPQGFLQVTGRDDKSRKQYKYHPEWTSYSSSEKFLHLIDFGKALPQIRERYEADLRKREWTKEKTLALAVAIMDEGYLRVGNAYYTRINKSFGLTTLRRKHLKIDKEGLHLEYIGKKGVSRKVDIENKRLCKLIQRCSELPGHSLLKYKAGGNLLTISSSDVNAYLRDISDGKNFTAKDFRTWGANALAIKYHRTACERVGENPRLKFETTLVKLVASYLGNTPSVCRSSYLHPKILTSACEPGFAAVVQKYTREDACFEPEELVLMAIIAGSETQMRRKHT